MHMFTILKRIQCGLKNHVQGQDLTKMDQAIKRINQAQGIRLLRTDYLENN